MSTCDRNIRVLLVDDEADFRRPVAKRLGRRGADVFEAAGGAEALSVLQNNPVDVVVLDVKMPEMDGLTALERIRAEHPGTEVILLTGQASAQDGVAGIKAGAFDYLTKPVELEHLFGKIRQAFDKVRQREDQTAAAEYRAKMEQRMIVAERLASLGTLAAGIAHEINNPLAIISEASGWLQGRVAKAADLPESFRTNADLALGKVSASVDRAKRITHQLLDFARQTESIMKECDVGDLVHEVIELTRKIASASGVEVLCDLQTGPARIWTDPYHLRQILINLVTNGIQAVDANGKVWLTVSEEDAHVVVAVQDNGPGIPQENLGRIFEPFFSTKPPGKGTGLGLSVSRGLVEKLGGRIEVVSRLGDGATFKVVIPKQPIIPPDRIGPSGGQTSGV